MGIDRIRERQAAAQQHSQSSPPPDDYHTTNSKRRRSDGLPALTNGGAGTVVASGIEGGERDLERVDEEAEGLVRRKRGGARRASEDVDL